MTVGGRCRQVETRKRFPGGIFLFNPDREMDEERELGQAFLQLRRASYDGPPRVAKDGFVIGLTKDFAPQEMKAEASEGVLTGYGSRFWVVDSYAEATSPGSFQRTIAERGPKAARNRIIHRYEHEHTCGRHDRMEEDAAGLALEAYISDDYSYGRTLRCHLADGIEYGLSIGYRQINGRAATAEDPLIWDYAPRWLRENPDPSMVWVLTEVKLMEVSSVTFPAVDNALIDSYKAALFDTTQRFEQVLASVKAGTLSPTQIGLLREIAAALPAARAPESSQAEPLPGAKADSDVDDFFAELDLTLALFEGIAA